MEVFISADELELKDPWGGGGGRREGKRGRGNKKEVDRNEKREL